MPEALPSLPARLPDIKPAELQNGEMLWLAYGQLSGYDNKRDFMGFWSACKDQYDYKMPRHNFQHAAETTWLAISLGVHFQRHDYEVDFTKLMRQAPLHDALYHLDHDPFPTKEALSDAIHYEISLAYGWKPSELIDEGMGILATTPDVEPVTVEDTILRCADVYNIGQDYLKPFIDVTLLHLREEHFVAQSQRRQFEPGRFVGGAKDILNQYVGQPFAISTPSLEYWRQQAVANIDRMQTEFQLAQEEASGLKVDASRLGATALKLFFEHAIKARKLLMREPKTIDDDWSDLES